MATTSVVYTLGGQRVETTVKPVEPSAVGSGSLVTTTGQLSTGTPTTVTRPTTTTDVALLLSSAVEAVRVVQMPVDTEATTTPTPAAAAQSAAWQVWDMHWAKLRDSVPTRQLFNIVQETSHSGLSAVLAGVKFDALYVLSSLSGAPLAKFIRKPGKSMLVYDNDDHLIGRVKRQGHLHSCLVIRDAQKKDVCWFKLNNFSKDWSKLYLFQKEFDGTSAEFRSGGVWKRRCRIHPGHQHDKPCASDVSAYDVIFPDGSDVNTRLLLLAAVLYTDMLWVEKLV